MTHVSSQGRYWNVGGNPDNFPASDKMLWALHLASGRQRDFRRNRPTQGEARELLKELNRKRAQGRQRQNETIEAAFFRAVYAKACAAATAAGDRWLEGREPVFHIYHPETDSEDPVYGALGEAFLRWPPKRSRFWFWLKANVYDGTYEIMPLPHGHIDRPEIAIQKVCCEAARDVFTINNIHGIKLHVGDDAS